MVFNELHGRHITMSAVRPLRILLSPPRLNHDPGFLSCQKPVLVQAPIAKFAIEALKFNTRVLDRLPWLNEARG